MLLMLKAALRPHPLGNRSATYLPVTSLPVPHTVLPVPPRDPGIEANFLVPAQQPGKQTMTKPVWGEEELGAIAENV